MLTMVALLAASTRRDRWAAFLWAFSFWDLRAVDDNPMADVVPRSRCAFSHSGSMDRTSLVSPAGEPSDYAGYCVASRGTISLTWRLGRAVRALLHGRNLRVVSGRTGTL